MGGGSQCSRRPHAPRDRPVTGRLGGATVGEAGGVTAGCNEVGAELTAKSTKRLQVCSRRIDALLVDSNGLFVRRLVQVVTLAAHYRAITRPRHGRPPGVLLTTLR
jgi:hypothetical protein